MPCVCGRCDFANNSYTTLRLNRSVPLKWQGKGGLIPLTFLPPPIQGQGGVLVLMRFPNNEIWTSCCVPLLIALLREVTLSDFSLVLMTFSNNGFPLPFPSLGEVHLGNTLFARRASYSWALAGFCFFDHVFVVVVYSSLYTANIHLVRDVLWEFKAIVLQIGVLHNF